MHQIDIFEYLELQAESWQDLPISEISRRIASEFGCEAKKDSLGEYSFKVGSCDVSVGLGRYNTLDERKGQVHIGISVWNKKALSGCACPCDSIEEAIGRIKTATGAKK